MKDHVDIAGVCGDRCEEDGDDRWHGDTFELGPRVGQISFAVHDYGTVEVLAQLWLERPEPEDLAALAQKLINTLAEFAPVDPDKVGPALQWVASAYEQGAIK